MPHSRSSSIKTATSPHLPTSLAPRPIDARKVSTATFGDGQRGSLLLPKTEAEVYKDTQTKSNVVEEHMDLPASDAAAINPEADHPSDFADHFSESAQSPTSLHTAECSSSSPSAVNADDHPETPMAPETPTHPETPQTSTSLASYLSDTSTLGPLATQQDIKDDPNRVNERRQVQRKKLEKMLGNAVDVEDNESGPGRVTVKHTEELEGEIKGQEDWILVADSPDLNKSKLERFLGHGADSAHLVLNTEYRRRTPDIEDVKRFSDESSSTAIAPLVKAQHSLVKPTFRAHSASEELVMANLGEANAKVVRTASIGTVFESGKNTLARLNPGSSALRRGRSESPDPQLDIDAKDFSAIRGGVPERLDADSEDMEERRMLRNRIRKIGRVLGETLKETEVGQHVVGSGRGRRNGDTSESTSIDGESIGALTRLSTLHEGASQLRLSLGPPPFEDDVLVKKLLLPSEDVAPGDKSTADKRLSVPLSPTIDGMRRHSDPISPMYPSSTDGGARVNSSQLADTEIPEEYTVGQAKRQRRMRLDKLNRLLGAHVPLALLGPAVYPKRSALSHEQTTDHSDDESEAAQAARKKRAVKVASKMFSLFGEPPPNRTYPPSTSSEDDRTEHSDDATGQCRRSKFRSSVVIYRQTIGSIRYLLEHDRRSLGKVMDELESGSNPAEPTRDSLATLEDRCSSPRPYMTRKRSLSSPSKITIPLAALETSNPELPKSGSEQPTNFDDITGLRKRAVKLNSFFGDPRIGSGYIGTRTKQYQLADRKAALEKLLLDLEDDAKYQAEQGDLKEIELEEIRTQLLDARQVVKADDSTSEGAL